MCANRLEDHAPMSLDEIETLIGKLDGSWKKGLRPWNPLNELR